MGAHAKRAHAFFSPSASERWLNCPCSARFEAAIDEREDSAASAFGTLCHELAEKALRAGWSAEVPVGEVSGFDERLLYGASEAITAWRAAWPGAREQTVEDVLSVVRPYVAYVQSLTTEGRTRRLEERVTVAGKDCWGSLDCSIYEPFGTLWIIDLKGGAGKCVEAQENPQLLTYAVGEAERYEWAFERVVLVIVQPRRTDGKPAVLEWETTPDRVRAHAKAVKAAIKSAKAIDARPVAGEHCGWCSARVGCPARRELATSVLGGDPAAGEPLALCDPKALTPLERAEILTHRKMVESWFEAVYELSLVEPPPGFKVVEGSSKRKWADEEAIHGTLLLADVDPGAFFVLKPIGVTEAEKKLKAMGKQPLAESLFVKPAGKPTLVPESDPRPVLDRTKCLAQLGDDE
jgi:hypothetical protein